MEELSTRFSVLESHVDSLVDSRDKYKNLGASLHQFTDELVRLDSFPQIITYILEKARHLFNFDIINLALIDDNGDIAKILNAADFDWENHNNLTLMTSNELLKATFNVSPKPYIGTYQSQKYNRLFSGIKPKPSNIAICTLRRRKKYLGSLNIGSYKPEQINNKITAEIIEIISSIITICLENYLHFETLQRTSFVDSLTGVNNRRFFEQRLDEELGRSQRNVQPLSCLFLDIDFFKSINDTYGHQGGDLVLSMVAAAIKTQMRSVDVLARYGGEEFVVILSNINELKALDIAERIRTTVADLCVELDESSISVTISIGVATYLPDPSKANKKELIAQLIKLADTALYQAKKNGRNRVENGGIFTNASITTQSTG